MIPIIISGGSGTRLWPVSRNSFPKQFCEILDESLFTKTLTRLAHLNSPWVITNQKLKHLSLSAMKNLNVEENHLILEPFGRNTAPAVALVCLRFLRLGLENKIVGIFPSDHLILNTNAFYQALEMAEAEAQKNKIVTIGIQADRPETGYGYIQVQAENKNNQLNNKPQSVVKFHEKPNLELAQKFISEGHYFWNAGMFIFRVETMIKLLQKLAPSIWSSIEKVNSDFSNLEEIYSHIQNISLDYAIIEKLSSEELSCVPCDIEWNDVGSWDALSNIFTQNAPSTLEHDAKNNYVHGIKNKFYSFVGLDDTIVIDTADALLVTKKGHSQDVKHIVEKLNLNKSSLIENHVFEYRPWGKFEILKDTNNFKSKVIHVNPKQQISYQSHEFREEHWILTQGQAEVVLNEKVIPMQKGDYIKIPTKSKHRIRNTSEDTTVEFIEVQLGSSFSESDIVRYDDDYNRK